MPFEGFDFTDFWEESAYAQKAYGCGPLTPAIVAEAEKALGYKLPAAYVWLMERHNGGVPVNRAVPTKEPTGWAEDYAAIEGIHGITSDPDKGCGILYETRLMVKEWGYPDIGIALCDCPSGGHDEIFLDYRDCGPRGEPKVVYVDQESDYDITPLADNFEEFIHRLVNEDLYDAGDGDE